MERYLWNHKDVSSLLGKTLKRVERIKKNELLFETSSGHQYLMCHDQSCCESVYLEDIIGDLEDLVGHPLLMSEVVTEKSKTEDGSQTWSFYKFATIKGDVTLRWYGESNGWYSEEVDFLIVPRECKFY
ncbi:hypothetical protein KLEB273_gp261 [Bacillus phage vB_BauM_KLEB27-3]|nr:hypothetical protein KLEB273_gp261 [Bacillus phage vB_BauM_KLEB27-3]